MGVPDGGILDPDENHARADVAPKRRGGGVRVGKSSKVVQALEGYYFLLGMTISVRNEYDGALIMSKAHAMAVSLEAVARKNERVYTILQLLTKGDGVLPIILSYGGVLYGLGANHGRVGVSEAALKVFDIPAPPPRAPRSIAENLEGWPEPAYEPTDGGPAPLPGWTVPAEPVPSDTEYPEGLHINEQLTERIRAEAYRKYEQALQDAARQAAQEAAAGMS